MLFGWFKKVPLWVWLALAATGVIGWQHLEIGHYKAKIIAVKAQSAAYVSAQKTQLATIAQLQASVKTWADKYAVDMAMGKTYTDAAVKYALQQQAQKKTAQTTIQRIYDHDPTARQWGDTRVPSGIANSLRANGSSGPH